VRTPAALAFGCGHNEGERKRMWSFSCLIVVVPEFLRTFGHVPWMQVFLLYEVCSLRYRFRMDGRRYFFVDA